MSIKNKPNGFSDKYKTASQYFACYKNRVGFCASLKKKPKSLFTCVKSIFTELQSQVDFYKLASKTKSTLENSTSQFLDRKIDPSKRYNFETNGTPYYSIAFNFLIQNCWLFSRHKNLRLHITTQTDCIFVFGMHTKTQEWWNRVTIYWYFPVGNIMY